MSLLLEVTPDHKENPYRIWPRGGAMDPEFLREVALCAHEFWVDVPVDESKHVLGFRMVRGRYICVPREVDYAGMRRLVVHTCAYIVGEPGDYNGGAKFPGVEVPGALGCDGRNYSFYPTVREVTQALEMVRERSWNHPFQADEVMQSISVPTSLAVGGPQAARAEKSNIMSAPLPGMVDAAVRQRANAGIGKWLLQPGAHYEEV